MNSARGEVLDGIVVRIDHQDLDGVLVLHSFVGQSLLAIVWYNQTDTLCSHLCHCQRGVPIGSALLWSFPSTSHCVVLDLGISDRTGGINSSTRARHKIGLVAGMRKTEKSDYAFYASL